MFALTGEKKPAAEAAKTMNRFSHVLKMVCGAWSSLPPWFVWPF
jgi:hypothetical protein